MFSKDESIKIRSNLNQLKSQLESEQTSFLSHWQDLSDFILPRRSRFTTSDINRGEKRNNKIIDSTATMAVRTLASGMMAGITSPARPWFQLDLFGINKELMKNFGPVRDWVDEVNQSMLHVFGKSNLYNVLPAVYADMGTFATGCMVQERDENNVVRFQSFPIGSYKIANDQYMRPRVFMREFRLTVRQVIEKFGRNKTTNEIMWENISDQTRSLFENGNTEAWIDIVHIIKPNEYYNPNLFESKFKKYASYYYEQGQVGSTSLASFSGGIDGRFLSVKGYDYFPVYAPRWEVTGEDVYGTNCPGMVALGDIKQLQLGEKRTMQAIDKIIDPPMIAPTSLKGKHASILPGDITYVDERDAASAFRPAMQVNFRINEMEAKQEQVRGRIRRAFFEDLFLQLSMTDRRQITAREIEERHSEKLLALGPVLEQLNQDLLDPLIDNTFFEMLDQGVLPPPPEEIQGMELKAEYVSIMSQAQKLIGLSGIERFTGFVSQIASIDPTVLDYIDSDELVNIYGDITSVPSKIIKSKEEVDQIRQQRAAQQKAQQEQMQAMQEAQSIKAISDVKVDENNLLGKLTAI